MTLTPAMGQGRPKARQARTAAAYTTSMLDGGLVPHLRLQRGSPDARVRAAAAQRFGQRG